MDERWKTVKTLSDTQQVHHVVAASPATVEHSRFPGAVTSVHNFVSETLKNCMVFSVITAVLLTLQILKKYLNMVIMC